MGEEAFFTPRSFLSPDKEFNSSEKGQPLFTRPFHKVLSFQFPRKLCRYLRCSIRPHLAILAKGELLPLPWYGPKDPRAGEKASAKKPTGTNSNDTRGTHVTLKVSKCPRMSLSKRLGSIECIGESLPLRTSFLPFFSPPTSLLSSSAEIGIGVPRQLSNQTNPPPSLLLFHKLGPGWLTTGRPAAVVSHPCTGPLGVTHFSCASSFSDLPFLTFYYRERLGQGVKSSVFSVVGNKNIVSRKG